MKRLLREPLTHFLLLGGVLFAVYWFVPSPRQPAQEMVVVSSSIIEGLSANFARTWQRPPTEQELHGLIQDHVRTEVLYRAGVEMGLDRDDSIIRNRVRQKMELFSTDLSALAEPTDADLQAYLDAHPKEFVTDTRFTLKQIYLNPQRRGASTADDAVRLLAQLTQPASTLAEDELGDPTILPTGFEKATISEIEAVLGPGFAQSLVKASPGAWQGPIQSSYGLHLVRVTERIDGSTPSLADVRDAVKRSWIADRQREAAESLYAQLLKRYTVTIERRVPASP